MRSARVRGLLLALMVSNAYRMDLSIQVRASSMMSSNTSFTNSTDDFRKRHGGSSKVSSRNGVVKSVNYTRGVGRRLSGSSIMSSRNDAGNSTSSPPPLCPEGGPLIKCSTCTIECRKCWKKTDKDFGVLCKRRFMSSTKCTGTNGMFSGEGIKCTFPRNASETHFLSPSVAQKLRKFATDATPRTRVPVAELKFAKEFFLTDWPNNRLEQVLMQNLQQQREDVKLQKLPDALRRVLSKVEADGATWVWLWHATKRASYRDILKSGMRSGGQPLENGMPSAVYMASTPYQAMHKANHAFGGQGEHLIQDPNDLLFAVPVNLGKVYRVGKEKKPGNMPDPPHSYLLEYGPLGKDGPWTHELSNAEWIIGNPQQSHGLGGQIDVENSIPFTMLSEGKVPFLHEVPPSK